MCVSGGPSDHILFQSLSSTVISNVFDCYVARSIVNAIIIFPMHILLFNVKFQIVIHTYNNMMLYGRIIIDI